PTRQVLVVDVAVLVVAGVGRRTAVITPRAPRVIVIVAIVARATAGQAARVTKETATVRLRGHGRCRARHHDEGCGGDQYILHVHLLTAPPSSLIWIEHAGKQLNIA